MADTHYIQWKTDTQEPIKMRVVDNGDGTYSLATAVTQRSFSNVVLSEDGETIAPGGTWYSPTIYASEGFDKVLPWISPGSPAKLKIILYWTYSLETSNIMATDVVSDGAAALSVHSSLLDVKGPMFSFAIENKDASPHTVGIGYLLR